MLCPHQRLAHHDLHDASVLTLSHSRATIGGMKAIPHIHGWLELADHLVRDHGLEYDSTDEMDSDALRRVHAYQHGNGNFTSGAYTHTHYDAD